jgi:N-methylhydantoinase B
MELRVKNEAAAVDPVKLEIIRTGLQSIPDLIEADIMRTAFSPLIYEYKDYAVGLVDAQGRAIALAQHGLPGFLTNILGLAVRDGIGIYGLDAIEPGDAIISNHAGTVGQHLNNVVMYTPIFGSGGRLLAFMAVNVHWIDIGGRVPGSAWGTDTTELIQEGLQLRSVKLYRRGEPVQELFRVIEYNTRQPEALLGDIAAQYAGCVKGRELFEQLLARHGEEVVLGAIANIWQDSEAAARAALRTIPPGVYRFASFLDDDGVDLGKRLPLDIKVQISGEEFVVDYSDIADEVRGPFNSGYYGGAVNSAQIAFKYLFSPEEPSNEGSFAPVRVVIPPGKLLSCSDKAPLGFYQTPLSTVIDTIIAAVAPVAPDRVAAGHFGSVGLYGFSGTTAGGRFFSFFDTLHGGWGASVHGDGVGPYKTIRHADNKDIPVETIEALYPLRVERYEWAQDSGGAGGSRGGLGIMKTFRALADCTFNSAFDRTACPPWGLRGGLAGRPQSGEIESTNGERRIVLKTSGTPLRAGECVHVHTGGGGGYESPLKRDLELIRMDVVRRYVSAAKARELYGVVLNADMTVDRSATGALRSAMTAQSDASITQKEQVG